MRITNVSTFFWKVLMSIGLSDSTMFRIQCSCFTKSRNLCVCVCVCVCVY